MCFPPLQPGGALTANVLLVCVPPRGMGMDQSRSEPSHVHNLLRGHFRVAQYVFYVTHWSACMFYFIAVQYGLDHDTWIGRHFDDVVDLPLLVR